LVNAICSTFNSFQLPTTGSLPDQLSAMVAKGRAALDKLRTRDREMVVARVEVQWSIQEIALRFGMASVDAARVAVSRSLKRLTAQLQTEGLA